LTALEKEELKRRGWSLGWWLMRGAFYETFTKYVHPESSYESLTLLTHHEQSVDSFGDKQAPKQTPA
jgi:hypothetical protein